MAYETTNPYTGKVVKRFDEISDKDLEVKLKQANDCFESDWRNRSFAPGYSSAAAISTVFAARHRRSRS